MASQEFLASFAVDIDESGVSRLNEILTQNQEKAEGLAGAFEGATASIQSFLEELGMVPGFSASGIVTEGMSGLGGLTLGLDTSAAESDLEAFIAKAKTPVTLSANASGIVSAARSAYGSVRSIFSAPIIINAKVKASGEGPVDEGEPVLQMSTGGRFTRPTNVEVAEDGDAEYIIPVKKESRAIPLLKQLLSELSPSARASLSLPDGNGSMLSASGGMAAGNAGTPSITQNNSNVSAPVSIQVHASGANAEQIGQKLYDTAERYLLRTLQGAMA